LKVAEIHDVYMVVSGERVCEEVHPCRVYFLIYVFAEETSVSL
jgi:hypothetical protein